MQLTIFSLLVSVLASSYSLKIIDVFESPFFNPLPGIVYGICLLIVFNYSTGQKYSNWKNFAFVVVSTAAYLAAVWVSIISSDLIEGSCGSWGPCNNQLVLSFFIGGMAGALLLFGLGAKLVLKLFTLKQIFILIVISGVLGSASVFTFEFFDSFGDSLPFLGLFLVWQAGVTWAASMFLTNNQKTISHISNV